jgi:hypothetical protein
MINTGTEFSRLEAEIESTFKRSRELSDQGKTLEAMELLDRVEALIHQEIALIPRETVKGTPEIIDFLRTSKFGRN